MAPDTPDRPIGDDSDSTGEQVTARHVGPPDEVVFCPVLGALVENGDLALDEAGRVRMADVGRAMRTTGISLPFSSALVATSPAANRAKDILRNAATVSFNLLLLRGGLVAHTGDSGILNGGQFDEARFRTFVSHSSDGETMTIGDFAPRASTDDGLRDGRRRANVRARANLAAVVNALGYEEGGRRVKIETLRDLYERKKLTFPEGSPPKSGLLDLFRVIRQMRG